MLDTKEFNKLLAAIKRCFSRSLHRRQVLDKVVSRKKGPRGGKMYTCKMCKQAFPLRGVQVDHIKPVVPVDMAAISMSWDTLVGRLYCDPKNLQVLCRECHKIKSKKEAKQRAKHRKDRKDGHSS